MMEVLMSPLLLESLTTLVGVASVYLLTVGRGLGWPLGCVWIVLTGYIYWGAGLLGSASLQLFFLITQLVGWWRWKTGPEQDLRMSSTFLTRRQRLAVAGALLASWPAAVWVLAKLGSVGVWADGFVTVGSLFAQGLMVLGKKECWLLWTLVNLVYVALNLSQRLWAFSLLYGLFLALAIHGWREWTGTVSRERE